MLTESKVSSSFSSKVQTWFLHVSQRITAVIVAAFVFAILYTGLLYSLQWCWIVYNATLVGETYTKNYPQLVHLIESVLKMNLFKLAFSLILLSSIKGVALTLLGQFLLLTRFTYESRSFFIKTLLWGIPLAALIAYEFVQSSNLAFKTAFLLALFPALTMINPCMHLAKKTVPDLKTIYTFMKKLLTKKTR